jgi:hypothetical protein
MIRATSGYVREREYFFDYIAAPRRTPRRMNSSSTLGHAARPEHTLALDSCQGFGPPGNARRKTAPSMPSPDLQRLKSMHTVAAPRGRLALELAGCIRSLALSTAGKLANVEHAVSAGYRVDLFCALSGCTDNQSEDEIRSEELAARSFVREFLRTVRHASDVVINCSYWPYAGEGEALTERGILRPELRQRHAPSYPYSRWAHQNPQAIPRTLAQAHKLYLVGEMRRRSGRRYELVWRQRPDYVSMGFDLALAAATLGPPNASVQYLVPGGYCAGSAHTDIEAVLNEAAADHYDGLLPGVERLYVAGGSRRFWGPEVLLDEHMRSVGKFRYESQPDVKLYRCSPYCFGDAHPCRLLPSASAHNPSSCSAGAPLQHCHHPIPVQCAGSPS